MGRKYCIVPMCTNSSIKTPGKLFFPVPCGNIRKKWLKVMKRADPLNPSSNVRCCEDHFDNYFHTNEALFENLLQRISPHVTKQDTHMRNAIAERDKLAIENDMENYVKYKLVGGRLKLKKDVVPHKFLCQKQRREVKERLAVQKRRKNEIINKILHDDLPTTSNNNIEEIFVQSATLDTVNEDPLESLEINCEVNPEPAPVKKCSKKIQVCITSKTSHKSTMTDEKFLNKS